MHLTVETRLGELAHDGVVNDVHLDSGVLVWKTPDPLADTEAEHEIDVTMVKSVYIAYE